LIQGESMARQARLCVEGLPHHVIQRGNNRQSIFLDDTDFQSYKHFLELALKRSRCLLHAYVLMDNHVHMIVTPPTTKALPQMMQSIGRDYARYFNAKYKRTGTLWEGRYRSNVIEADRYMLSCMTYIDLNPIRAGICRGASEYQHSSYRHYAGLLTDTLLTTPQSYWMLGNTPFSRETSYRELVAIGLTLQQIDVITYKTLFGWTLGADAYIEELQAQRPNQRLRPGIRGRPINS
jgi:putative transposase